MFSCVSGCSDVVGIIGKLDDGRDLLICSLGKLVLTIDCLNIFEFWVFFGMELAFTSVLSFSCVKFKIMVWVSSIIGNLGY